MKVESVVDAEKSGLTRRENELLALLCDGKSQQEMSDSLHRSRATVSTHLAHIKQKLGAFSSTHAMAIAFARGIVSYKKFLVYGIVFSSVSGLITPSPAYAGDDDLEPPTERVARVKGGSRVRVRARRREVELGNEEFEIARMD